MTFTGKVKVVDDTKLKTLKDLKLNQYDDDREIVGLEELKAEAIKQIKSMQNSPFPDGFDGEIEWIKWFFNITEDDLKNDYVLEGIKSMEDLK